MTDTPQPTPAPKRVTNFNNWISAAGGVLAVGALFSFALLVAMDFTQEDKNPYLGILTYLVAPMFLIAGLSFVFLGWWQQRRHRRLHAGGKASFWAIDWDNSVHRRRIVVFVAGGAVFLLLSAFGSYQTYHYAESNVFCGQVCHSAMNAEFQTYQRGAHARVACVECHVGSGAKAFVEAKLNGTRQLYGFIFDNYNRPIPTPVHNLRPAQETCEKCHWPEKFLGNLDMNWEHYLSDRKNTPYAVRMLMRVNNGRPGSPLNGIHWHVSKDQVVEYYAIDEKLQDIVWMRVLNKQDGSAKIFRNEEFKGEPPANRIRVMDCIDCHNRPAHVFPPANDSVERAMALGKISTELPNIKRHAVAAMTQESIKTGAEAPGKIAEYLKGRYKDAPGLTETIAEVQRIYAATMFPERKADWRQYPNNIGHKDWPGCFRCHDDKHSTASGEKVRASDCTSCHIILSQGKGAELATLSASGLEFKHPAGDYDAELRCADCHNGGIQGK
ncbi:MAG: NapC/NirT family cytochrome c [Candidatus Didemnitutus sp.]|nr:NapC/NirT family cytochrome c [Candidatus Didemnitutus sp.]